MGNVIVSNITRTPVENGSNWGSVAAPLGGLLYSTDLSTGLSGFSQVDSVDSYSVVTNNPPPSETHSLRLNLKTGVTDSITGKTGSNLSTTNVSPGSNLKTGNDVQTWSIPFRYDDCTWGSRTKPAVNAKLVYMGHYGASSQEGFYLSGSSMGGSGGTLNCGDNWTDVTSPWDGWEARAYGWRDGGSSPTDAIYGATGGSFGSDGLWHTFKIQIDYLNSSAGYTRFRALIDGNPTIGTNSDASGWMALPPEFNLGQLRLCYADAASSSGGVDGTGQACGLQWGDLNIYSGLV